MEMLNAYPIKEVLLLIFSVIDIIKCMDIFDSFV